MPSPTRPDPLPPDEVLHIQAEASTAFQNSLRILWQAERISGDPWGGSHTALSSGEILWLSALDRLQLASGGSLPDGYLALDGGGLLLSFRAMEGGLELADVVATLLGDDGFRQHVAGPAEGPFFQALARLALGQTAEIAILDLRLDPALLISGPVTLPGTPWAGDPAAIADPVLWLVTMAHETLLDRPPSPAETARWGGLLAGGGLDARGLMDAILAGGEFQNAHAGADDAGFVAAIWRNVLAQDAAPEVITHWAGQLSAQVLDRADLALMLGMAAGPHPSGQDWLHPG